MVKHAHSERFKRCKKQQVKNTAERKAVAALKAQELESDDGVPRRSLRAIAKQFGVSRSTLSKRMRGQRSAAEFNASRQKLLPTEERVLADFVKESADRGFPLTHKHIDFYANALLHTRLGPDYEPVGEQWTNRFLERFHDELQMHWSRPLDMQRAQSLNPEAVAAWFDLVEKFVVKAGVLPELVFGMDESGFPTGIQGRQRVVGGRGVKTQHKQGGANKENVTALVTICADGTTLDPMIIFKGKRFMKSWGDDNIANAAISFSENGWTDGGLARQWIEKVFDRQTREKAAGRPRVLLLDGHSSHYSYSLLEYARANNIIILGYPPHCTHALQGLDVVCFARMKESWKQEIQIFEDLHKREVKKSDFTGVFGRAYLRAFTSDTVKAAFKATGVHPFNRDAITPEQMKPSVTTSVKGSFPLPQPSPVRAIMAVFCTKPPTAYDVSENILASGSHSALEDPSTPTRRHTIDLNIDPSLYTPSKRARFLYGALGSTATGSYLVSSTKITSAHHIHAPVLESPAPLPALDLSLIRRRPAHQPTKTELEGRVARLEQELSRAHQHIEARDLVIESNQAQLVLQHMVLDKQNQVLHAKETGKETDRTALHPKGFGQCMTAEEVVLSRKEAEDEKARKIKEKGDRAAARSKKKDEKAALEQQWQDIKLQHEAAVREWEGTCRALIEQGVKKKDLPHKPVRASKPGAKKRKGGEESSGDESGSDAD